MTENEHSTQQKQGITILKRSNKAAVAYFNIRLK